MRTKTKMLLINNYVDIYKLLYACNAQKGESTSNLCVEIEKLKSKYERCFQKLKIDDTSFLVLQKSLEEGLRVVNPYYIPCEFSKMNQMKTKISETLDKVSLKYKLKDI